MIAFAAVASAASASLLDATITINHSLNSPTLAIHYSGASASLAELRLNGQSVQTRSLDSKVTKGDTTFTLDLASLHDGDNNLEVRLYDGAGHMVGSEKSVVSTDDGMPSPFYVSSPKMGATLMGPVEIKVGFGQTFTGSTVSFFIDNRFVLMTNSAPYSYTWDTLKEKNGWHELESWLVDDSSTTYKTRRIRVFVNNPAGNTNRHFLTIKKPVDITAKGNVTSAIATGPNSGLKNLGNKGTTTPAQPRTDAHPVSITDLVLAEALNMSAATLAGNAATIKPAAHGAGVANGVKFMTPTGTRNADKAAVAAKPTAAVKPTIFNPAAAAKPVAGHRLLPIRKGSRLAGLSTFSVLLNDEFVTFDVQPRIDEGVPMTPLRYLLEKDGGTVKWDNASKTVFASAEGHDLSIQIGEVYAHVDKLPIKMERAPYLLSSRTIVPLSFIHDALNVNVEYDKATNHVLITSRNK